MIWQGWLAISGIIMVLIGFVVGIFDIFAHRLIGQWPRYGMPLAVIGIIMVLLAVPLK